MASNINFAKRITLNKISDAIKYYQEKQNHIINVKIPANEFALALLNGIVTTTAPEATENLYKIERQTLVDVADVIRSIDGTTDEILGADFEKRILNLFQKLDTPVVEIVEVDVDGDGEVKPTLTKLATPKIRIVTVTEDEGGDVAPTLTKLDAPIIEIVPIDSEDSGEELPTLKQLDTPVIEIIEVPGGEEKPPEIVITKLARPIISLVKIDGESGEEETPTLIKLTAPIIEIVTVDVEDGGEPLPAPTKLQKPKITLIEISDGDDEEEQPTLTKLDTPTIEIVPVSVEAEQEPEYAITKLAKPSITFAPVSIEAEEEIKPSMTELSRPVIVFGWIIETDDVYPEQTITKLFAPIVEIATEFVEGDTNVVKLYFNNNGYIDSEGEIITDINASRDKYYTDIIPLHRLTDGPEGYCVTVFDPAYTEYPKVLFFSDNNFASVVGSFTIDELGNQDSLTVSQILALASSISGAKYVAFNSDIEVGEDYVYVTEEPGLTKLATPSIEFVFETVSDKTPAIMGKAIMGITIMGDYVG